jgi:hypothetical protein
MIRSTSSAAKGLATRPHLRAIGRQINAKLMDVERVADGVIPAPSFFERLQLQPCRRPASACRPALRFGDPRATYRQKQRDLLAYLTNHAVPQHLGHRSAPRTPAS